jgi:uncharacterized secreted protein with C-terminal beta-propeller domain
VGGYDTSGWAWGVAVAGNYAYVADGQAGLQVIDVSNPARPVHVGAFETSGSASDVAIAGNYAYVAEKPRWAGNNYIGGGGLEVIDVSNPANPARVGGYDSREVYAEGVAVASGYAYVADYRDGVQVINVSNPANPARVRGFGTGGYAWDVAIAGNYAYVADGGDGFFTWPGQGLVVFDISTQASPARVGSFAASAYSSGVTVSGNLIYVADYQQGLLILEQSTAPPPPAEWVRIQTDPARTPRARHGHAMVYDEQREVILMHGGRMQRGDGTVVSDTWQWDGQTWTQVATNGPRVFQHNMAYDPSRGVTVLYGGGTPEIKPITGDTWEWDGQSWALIEAEPATPRPSVWGGMAYDPERKKVIRHGGETVADTTYDVGATWEWNGQTWTQIADGFIHGGLAVAGCTPWPTMPSGERWCSLAASGIASTAT